MTAQWDRTVAGFPKPGAGTKIPDHLEDNTQGVDSAISWNALATDPDDGWGSSQEGWPWNDIGIVGTSLNPRLARWEDLTGGGSWGWRYLCLRYLKWLTAPQAITFSPAPPYTADLVYTDVDLTTLLNLAGVQDHDDKLVDAVLLRVTVVDTGTLGVGSANEVWAAFRQKGATSEKKVRCFVSDVVNEAWIWVPLDSAEAFQFSIQVANTTPSFTLTAEVLAFMETI